MNASGPYCEFFLNNGKITLASRPLKYFEEILVENGFIRIHNSHLVNCHCIDQLTKAGEVLLNCGKSLPVSRRRKQLVLDLLST